MNGNQLNSRVDIANCLNKVFFDLFNNDDSSFPTQVSTISTSNEGESASMNHIVFTVMDVKDKLEKLDATKSIGLDKVHPKVLKECSQSMSYPLMLIFKRSFETGELPSFWKMANVTPIHKKGIKTDPNNYRPVSLTSVVCKVMERIIRDKMMQHLAEHDLINVNQHGFVMNKSCTTNLLESVDTITEALNRGFQAAIIFLDFAKAFDSVQHNLLIQKLDKFGFRGKLTKWLLNFLTNREQRVVVGKASSEWLDVLSGLPQGSVLGPLLFVIFINARLMSANCLRMTVS